jgi:manganese oxidase
VRVVPHEIRYSDQRTDPLGMMYTLDGTDPGETLVLRCRVGEWVEIELHNDLPGPGEATPFDPVFSAKDDPERREISEWVSLHAGSLLRNDVRTGDGSYVGSNPRSQVKPGGSITMRWFADREGVVLLQDRADIRNHRHRGLVGALVIEPAAATPADWTGERTTLRLPDGSVEHELVLVLQDGVRLYHDGDPTQPVTDLDDEPEDQGQKAFNHRSAHLLPRRPTMAQRQPETPLLEVARGDAVRLHLVCGTDRARNHSFEVHGRTWPMEEHLNTPRVGSIGALSVAGVRSLRFTASGSGDWAYRTGVLRWGLTEGLWGLIRVR